jgi:hypothetical protein
VSYITGEGILQARGSAFAHARPAQAGHAQKPYLAIGKNLAMIAAQCRQTEGGPDVPGNGNEQYLFSTRDILLVLESQKAKLVKRAQEIPGNTLLNASEHEPRARPRGGVPARRSGVEGKRALFGASRRSAGRCNRRSGLRDGCPVGACL